MIYPLCIPLAKNKLGLHPQWQDVIEYVLNVRKNGYFEGFLDTFKEVFEEDKEAVMTLEEYFTEKGVLRGIEQGREQGREQGIAEGKHAEAIEIARKMVDEGIKVDFIKKITGLDDEDLQPLLWSH